MNENAYTELQPAQFSVGGNLPCLPVDASHL